MTTYAELDGVINSWVRATGSTLYTEWAGAPARFFHIGGDAPFECFQVSVGTAPDSEVTVTARAIDTNDDTDEDMDETWEGPAAELDGMLSKAVATIEEWKSRQRTKLDPRSPW